MTGIIIVDSTCFGTVLRILRHRDSGIHLCSTVSQHRKHSLDNFKRSWRGQAPAIFEKLPVGLRQLGLEKGWEKIKKLGKEYLNGTLQKYQEKIIKRNNQQLQNEKLIN